MIRLPFSERGFALALIVSAAIHAALLPVLLSFASGSAPMHVQPIEESCINAFLVPGTLDAAGKTMPSPGRKGQKAGREAAPVVAVAPPQEVPKQVAPVKKEDRNLPADVETPAERFGKGHDAYVMSALASPPLRILAPGGGELSDSNGAGSTSTHPGGVVILGSNGTGSAAAHRGGEEFSGGDGAGSSVSLKGKGTIQQEGSGDLPLKDVVAIPRYGINAIPVYPPLARLRGYQGVVILVVEVLVDGRVGRVGIRQSAGHEILDRAALEAVRSWRFEPGRKGGRAAAMTVEVPVRFVLNGNSDW